MITKIKDNLGIIGVMILATIIIIIASITYTYIESIRIKPVEEITDYIEGTIINIYTNETITFSEQQYHLFQVTILNKQNQTEQYDMFFYNLYPPLDQIPLRLYYDPVNINDETVYRIVRVEMI